MLAVGHDQEATSFTVLIMKGSKEISNVVVQPQESNENEDDAGERLSPVAVEPSQGGSIQATTKPSPTPSSQRPNESISGKSNDTGLEATDDFQVLNIPMKKGSMPLAREHFHEQAVVTRPFPSFQGQHYKWEMNEKTGLEEPVEYTYKLPDTTKGFKRWPMEQSAEHAISSMTSENVRRPGHHHDHHEHRTEIPSKTALKSDRNTEEDIQQPEQPYTSVIRVKQSKITQHRHNIDPNNAVGQRSTPPHLLSTRDNHHVPRAPSSVSQRLPAANPWKPRRIRLTRIALDPGDGNFPKAVHSLVSSRERDHKPLGDSVNLCTSEENVGQGRRERTPYPKEKEMKRCHSPGSKPRTDHSSQPVRSSVAAFGAFQALNSLNRPSNTAPRQTEGLRSRTSKDTSGSTEKAFDLGHRSKRLRLDSDANRAGSSATSPVEVDDRSNTARSDNSRPPLPVRRRNSNYNQSGLVSDVSEYKQREALTRESNKRRMVNSSQSSQPSKKQCLDNGVVTSKGKILDLPEGEPRSSKATSPHGVVDLDDDIEEVSPVPTNHKRWQNPNGSYTGTANLRPACKPTGGTFHDTSRYFASDKPGSRPGPTKHKIGNRQQMQDSDDSMDELALDNQNRSTKEHAARRTGEKLVETFCKDRQNDIPKSRFQPSKYGNTKTSDDRFNLSSFVAGDSKWQDAQDSGVFHLSLNRASGMFEPYKDGRLVSRELAELVVDPKTLIKVSYGTDSKVIWMKRRTTGAQTSNVISFQLGKTVDPAKFMTVLSNTSPGPDITTATTDQMSKLFRNLWNQPPRPARPKPVISGEEVGYLNERKKARQESSSLLSQKNEIPSLPGNRRAQLDNDEVAQINQLDYTSIFAGDRSRRSTRAATQTQKSMKVKSPSPSPAWTEQNPKWHKDLWGSLKSQLSYPPVGKNQAVVDLQDIERLNEGQFLNDNLISFYMRYLQENLQRENPEVAEKVHFHNSFFYETLTKGPGKTGINYNAVSRWTSKVDLFSKDFIIVPINDDLHWFLAIIYNAPALKTPESEPLSEEKEASIHSDEKSEFGNVRLGVTARAQQANDQSKGANSTNDDSPLPSLEKMSIADNDEKKHVYSILEQTQNEDSQSHPVSEELPSAVELGNRGTPAKEVIPDSQPNSPRASSKTPSRVSRKFAIQEPEERAESSSASASKRSSKKNKKMPPVRILLLDSLGIKHPATISNLKEYMVSEADAKLGMTVDKASIGGINVTKIPKQNNGCDCGLFLLGYAAQFLKNPTFFVDSILNAESAEQMHWGHMVASDMRARIRSLIFDCKADQDGRPKPSAAMARTSENINLKSSQTSSREGSERLGRSRPAPRSPSRQLREHQSRPTSASSQDLEVLARRIKDATKYWKRPKSSEEGRIRGEGLMAQFGGGNAKREEARPSLPIAPIVPIAPIAPDSPSRSSTEDSAVLEPPLVPSHPPKARSASTSRQGSPNNPIALNEDQTPPSSRGTLHNQTFEAADSTRPVNNTVLRLLNAPLSTEVRDSQERMLLDDEEGDEGDNFLKHPVTPDAISDKSKISSAALDVKRLRGTSASVSTPVQSSAGLSYDVTPNSKMKPKKRPTTYSAKRNGHTSIGRLPAEVVDLVDD